MPRFKASLPSPKRLAFAEALAQAGCAQAGEILCRERFQTVPYGVRRNKPAPCIDTGRDESNPAKHQTEGYFSPTR